ncbi:MAG TPA: TonB-dependent receptor [Smithellaceae bacterium]|nr:TonB-dependent receptor [Smithellaceae bacterium]HRS89991.1 TonB-dependent receptor [Smithellaceae bacterium]HRV26048.1 TonB-dependent receptor [Smithellaceae bacterium]
MKKIFVSILFCSLVFAAPSLAENKKDEEPTVKLNEIVVTATRDAQEALKAPANVTVITAKEIEKSGATNVVQLMEFAEGIQIRSYSGNPAQTMIDLRGFGGDNPFGKTLILLDGRKLNRPDMSPANLMQIPLNNIEKVEIIRGASSVLYGDAAIGGVINIITKRGAAGTRVDAAFSAGSYGFHDEKAGISGSAGNFSYSLNGQNQFTQGYRDHAKFSFLGIGANLAYDVNSFLMLSLDGSISKTAFDMPGGLTKNQMKADPRQVQPGHENDDAEELYRNLHGKINLLLGKFGRLEGDLYYGGKLMESNFVSYWPPNQFNKYDIKTFGLTPKYVWESSFAVFSNKLIAGVDCYHETMKLNKYADRKRTTKTHYVDFTKDTLGFYIRNELNILPNLILAGGYRTESAEYKGKHTTLSPFSVDFDAAKKHHAQAWEASLTYLFGRQAKIYAKYAGVYRYPFLDEQASYYGFFNTFNLDIEKEKGNSYELGATYYPFNNLKIQFALYRIDMEDEISADPVTWQLVNLDKTTHIGSELGIAYSYKKYFTFSGNLTYKKAVFTGGVNDGNDVPMVPCWMANANLEIFLPYNISLNPRLRYVDKAYLANDYDNSAERLKGYARADFYLYWRPEIKGKRAFFFAGLENITNEKYAVYGIDMAGWSDNLYYPADGLIFKGGLSITF